MAGIKFYHGTNDKCYGFPLSLPWCLENWTMSTAINRCYLDCLRPLPINSMLCMYPPLSHSIVSLSNKNCKNTVIGNDSFAEKELVLGGHRKCARVSGMRPLEFLQQVKLQKTALTGTRIFPW